MRRSIFLTTMLLGILFCFVSTSGAEWPKNRHRLGVGLHYWASIEDIIIEEADDAGLALMLSYQYQIAKLFTFEADLEFMGEGYAGAPDTVIAPQIYALIGRGLYGGLGIGLNYSGGDWANSPFFALRAGLDLEIVPSVFLDLNANYRSEKWDFGTLGDDIQWKTITLGAIIRYEF